MKQSFFDSSTNFGLGGPSILDIKSILYKINTLESFVWRMKPDVYHEGLRLRPRQGRKTNLMILKIRLYLINECSLLNCNYTSNSSRLQMIYLRKLQMLNFTRDMQMMTSKSRYWKRSLFEFEGGFLFQRLKPLWSVNALWMKWSLEVKLRF